MGEIPAHLILFQFWCQQFCGTNLGHNATGPFSGEICGTGPRLWTGPASVEKGLCGSWSQADRLQFKPGFWEDWLSFNKQFEHDCE